VSQVIGASTGISWNLFNPGNTIAAQLANEYQSATSNLEVSSLFYLAVMLLVFSLTVNLVAQSIVRRVARRQGLAVR
jgi:phosphate transport system permease protein